MEKKTVKTKERVWEDFNDFTTLEDFKIAVEKLIEKYGPNTSIANDDWTDEVAYYVTYNRLETDQEYLHRLKKEKEKGKRQERQKEKRLREYLKLKQEFEGQ